MHILYNYLLKFIINYINEMNIIKSLESLEDKFIDLMSETFKSFVRVANNS